MNQKGFAPIFVIIIIVLILGTAGGAYYFGFDHGFEKSVKVQASPTPQATQSLTQDLSTNWKTYIDNKYQFEFKYPDNYQVTVAPLLQTKSNIYDGPFLIFNIKKVGENISSITINPEGLIVFNLNPAAKKTENRKIGSLDVSRYHFINNVGAEVEYYRGFNNPKLPYFTIETYAQGSASRDDINQILSTFKFLDSGNVTNSKNEHVLISGEYSFDIQIPNTYTIKKFESNNSLTKDAASIADDQGKEVLSIYTYATGERTPIGNLTINSVPFTINYFKDIQCGAHLDATNWEPGTQPLFSILVTCDKATAEQLAQYKTIIQSIKFSPALKNVLMGN
jgi:hypothetical protein